jgi:S-adenosylmethionine-diacylgycerolhomoserine-N-methlytransferase
LSDLRVLYHLAVKPVRGSSHAARMESFYAGQADAYDGFRRRLLQGRRELWQRLGVPEGGVWVDLGAGTGSNLEFFSEELAKLHRVYLVDISPSLLAVARTRVAECNSTNVEVVEADATRFQPECGSVDVVTFSYSLTMIPDWFAAVDNALSMLKPGGRIGVVDFYVSRKHPEPAQKRHGWLTRAFWPLWFGGDNVFPSPDHVPYLHHRFEPVAFEELRARVPYLPLGRVPYYLFVGRKPLEDRSTIAALA